MCKKRFPRRKPIYTYIIDEFSIKETKSVFFVCSLFVKYKKGTCKLHQFFFHINEDVDKDIKTKDMTWEIT